MTGGLDVGSTRTKAIELTVALDEARNFAGAAGDHNALYESGVMIPPLFGHVLAGRAAFELYRLAFPEWPNIHMIHLASDAHFYQAIVPGTNVIARAWWLGVQPSTRGALLSHACSLSRGDGVPMLENYTTVLLPERRDETQWGVPAPEVRVEGLRRASSVARRIVTIEDDQPDRYARMSGDKQAIHLDDEAARAAGFPRRVLHGACTMAMCAAAVVDLAADGHASRLARLAMRFHRPVHPGDRLSIEISHPLEFGGVACHAVRAACGGRTIVRAGRADVRP